MFVIYNLPEMYVWDIFEHSPTRSRGSQFFTASVLPFCCVVVILPFSASLEVMVHDIMNEVYVIR